MQNPKNLDSLDHYDYTLPERLIASRPKEERTDARLLVVERSSGTISHCHVRDLPNFLRPNDCLVLNNTKVTPARLRGVRTLTGGAWEGLFLEPVDVREFGEDDAHFKKFDTRFGRWRLLGSTRGKLMPGENITLHDRYARPYLRLLLEKKVRSDGSWIAIPLLDGEPTGDSCWEILEQVGSVPIPPYIRKGNADEQDKENYQTVYAEEPGAVAAPTAGLHFTNDLLQRIEQRGVQKVFVTLHVGIGTFRPISVENLNEHHMHREWAILTPESSEALRRCRADGGRIVAVGTTSVRVLESASANFQPYSGYTELFIRPPYQFHAVDALMTNFHLPKSSLLVLTRTFGGDDLIQRAYREAIEREYRFYSYGDAMIIF
ncbi:MAG: tRNA preQ1(34) S-adenosylmethionine ribosyltransferase-isomerase QueA [Planctomycetia bacterium]|nr:tRNA preQ1(34) S-adenosylmethionine ribosyltransferase-isomerase QueA [Planctomycetia bacterium]